MQLLTAHPEKPRSLSSKEGQKKKTDRLNLTEQKRLSNIEESIPETSEHEESGSIPDDLSSGLRTQTIRFLEPKLGQSNSEEVEAGQRHQRLGQNRSRSTIYPAQQ